MGLMHFDKSNINARRMSGLSCRVTLFYNREHQGHRVSTMRNPASILVVDHCIHDSCIWIASEARIKGSSTIIDMGCRLAMVGCTGFLYCKKVSRAASPCSLDKSADRCTKCRTIPCRPVTQCWRAMGAADLMYYVATTVRVTTHQFNSK